MANYRLEGPHPIFKWVGGKRSLLNTFDSNNLIPKSFGRYYEPFFGAGALFFHLWNEGLIKKATLSDINSELYNVYNLVKTNCSKLITYSYDLDLNTDKKTYYENRSNFNRLKMLPLDISTFEQKLERAILMMYLNKTCYSGMYRENKDGLFNVPYGNYKNPKILDETNLSAVSESFKNVTLKNIDYKAILKYPRFNDFVYLDPPYMPYEDVSHFRDYHRTGFDNTEQCNLRNIYEKLDAKGCLVLLSNSSNPDLNEMYKSLSGVRIDTVSALRLINQKKIGRKFVPEYVIWNY